MIDQSPKVLVVGAGMAGCDAAYFLASRGVEVILVDCKRKNPNPSQKLTSFAELVCTNSLKSLQEHSAHGLLKHEMKGMGSLILECAQKHAVPAGDALAVDRVKFSEEVTTRLQDHPLIRVIDEEVVDPISFSKELECGYIIVASGPLTTKGLEGWIKDVISDDDLYFYDAIAPVVDADSLDFDKLYFKDRYKPVGEKEAEQADYLNAPLTKKEYEDFIQALVEADKVEAKNFEEYKFFESCLPIDIMAERGADTARFSCMKPVGLEMPDGTTPYACVQLRKENLLGSAFNLVGFQNRLKYGEQTKVFRMIPGLEKAQFLHLGSVHRNTFLNARKVLNTDLSCKKNERLYFAGQIAGVEGYTESASMGLYVAFQVLRKILGKEPLIWPTETGIGALVHYIQTNNKPTPSNINFGLLPSVELPKEQRRDRKNRKKVKKMLASKRANDIFDREILSEVRDVRF